MNKLALTVGPDDILEFENVGVIQHLHEFYLSQRAAGDMCWPPGISFDAL